MNQIPIKMSKRPFDTNQNKMSRNDRFVQMSQQEMLIEQKKREIQAKLEAKRRLNNQDLKDKVTKPPDVPAAPSGSSQPKEVSKSGVNQFSNDGSFLNQFNQLSNKKHDSKFKTFNKYKDKERERVKEKAKELEQDKETDKERDIIHEPEDAITDEETTSIGSTRFSVDQPPPVDTLQSIPIDTTNPPPNHFTQAPPQQIIDSPVCGSLVAHSPSTQSSIALLTDFSVPPQFNLSCSDSVNFTSQASLTTVPPHMNPSLPPPTASIISSNPPPLIQPIIAQAGGDLANAGQLAPTNVPSPATAVQQPQALITQTLGPPTHIFATSASTEQIVAAPSQVLLNVPPPQILPQTQIVITPSQDQNVLVSAPASLLTTVTIPPPVLAPQNITLTTPPPGLSTVGLTSMPPPNSIQIQNITQSEPLNAMNIPPPAPLQVTSIPIAPAMQLSEMGSGNKPIDLLPMAGPSDTEDGLLDAHFLKNVPPPNKNLPPPNVADVSFLANGPQQGNPSLLSSSISSTPPQSNPPTRIPSLMSQRVLPPPGMGVNVPPPIIHQRDVSKPPPNFSPIPMPNINVPPPMIRPPTALGRGEIVPGGAEFEAMANLARMVAECGPSVEEVVRQKKNRDPDLWFLFHKDSAAYRQYANLVEQYKREREEKEKEEKKPDLSEIYEPEMALEDDDMDMDSKEMYDIKREIKQEDSTGNPDFNRRERKRKSRWGEKAESDVKAPITLPVIIPPIATIIPPVPGSSTMLSKVTRTDPGLLQYAMQTYGSVNLSDEDWKKAEDNYKIHLLYQDMIKKRAELEKLESQGKNKYEYDSDEETDGGTWEHKLREKEMQATELWAHELTRQAEGKHHIGDFLPPEELKRFMEKSSAVKEGRQPNFSDYKEFKIKEDNIGFKMLQKLGWAEGQGLGQNSTGIVEPINKGAPRENTQGLGLNLNEATEDEDEYESYRKRMMLAYRFRPNPLNNPRRPYY